MGILHCRYIERLITKVFDESVQKKAVENPGGIVTATIERWQARRWRRERRQRRPNVYTSDIQNGNIQMNLTNFMAFPSDTR